MKSFSHLKELKDCDDFLACGAEHAPLEVGADPSLEAVENGTGKSVDSGHGSSLASTANKNGTKKRAPSKAETPLAHKVKEPAVVPASAVIDEAEVPAEGRPMSNWAKVRAMAWVMTQNKLKGSVAL